PAFSCDGWSERRHLECSGTLQSPDQRLQLPVPRRAIRPHERRIRLRIAGDGVRLPVPLETAPQAERQVREVARDRDAMGAREVGDGRLARADALQEVLRVLGVLLVAVAGLVIDGGGAWIELRGRSGFRPADRVPLAHAGNLVRGRYVRLGR